MPKVVVTGVDQLFKLFAGFEISDAFCRDLDGRSGFRIAAFARISFAHAETAKAAQLDLFSAVQRLDNAVEDYFDQLFGVGKVRTRTSSAESERSRETARNWNYSRGQQQAMVAAWVARGQRNL